MKVTRVLRGALAGKNMLVEGPGVAETLGMELPEPSQKERGPMAAQARDPGTGTQGG